MPLTIIPHKIGSLIKILSFPKDTDDTTEDYFSCSASAMKKSLLSPLTERNLCSNRRTITYDNMDLNRFTKFPTQTNTNLCHNSRTLICSSNFDHCETVLLDS
ncbi:uncharacterized protein LOC117644248 [Thrips palmi]|uniref:Uncharacterized protein LOC117644248 n=1 Tax=Thrips palmi TaxID=161013 RepID=A0A6P8ZLT6_THRPL|nr:uncharacterized protein LOC117644248 [Thrips palmi]